MFIVITYTPKRLLMVHMPNIYVIAKVVPGLQTSRSFKRTATAHTQTEKYWFSVQKQASEFKCDDVKSIERDRCFSQVSIFFEYRYRAALPSTLQLRDVQT